MTDVGAIDPDDDAVGRDHGTGVSAEPSPEEPSPEEPSSEEPLCDRARRLLAARSDGTPAVDPDRADRAEHAEAEPVDPDLLDPADDPVDRVVVLLRRAIAHGEWSAPELLASTYLDRGARRLAVGVLTPAVHRQGRADLACLLGETLADLGDHEYAEAAFMRGLDAGDPPAMNGYGLFLWGRGRTQEAAFVLDRAARAGDDLAPLNLVTLYLDELDDPVGATVVAQEFHDEARPSTLVALADVRLAAGRLDDAETLYRRAVELRATCAPIYYAWFLQDRRDDADRAEEQLRKAHEQAEPRAAYHLARFLFDVDRLDEAQPLFEEAAARGDADAEAVLEAEYRGLVDPWDD